MVTKCKKSLVYGVRTFHQIARSPDGSASHLRLQAVAFLGWKAGGRSVLQDQFVRKFEHLQLGVVPTHVGAYHLKTGD